MSLGNTTETDALNYLFRGVAPGWAGNANFWLAAYTADPGEAGTATTSEAAYGSYARVAVVRSSELTVSGNQVQNTALIQFPQSTIAGADITHLGLVTTASGAGQIIARAVCSSAIPTSVGIQPQVAANNITWTID